jgi:hypothetical protein
MDNNRWNKAGKIFDLVLYTGLYMATIWFIATNHIQIGLLCYIAVTLEQIFDTLKKIEKNTV